MPKKEPERDKKTRERRKGFLGDLKVQKGPIEFSFSTYQRGSIPRYKMRWDRKPSEEKIKEMEIRRPPPTHVNPKTVEEAASHVHDVVATALKGKKYIGKEWVEEKVSRKESEENLANAIRETVKKIKGIESPDEVEFASVGLYKVDLVKRVVKRGLHEKLDKDRLTLSELIKAMRRAKWKALFSPKQ